jgi:hypothetical protein
VRRQRLRDIFLVFVRFLIIIIIIITIVIIVSISGTLRLLRTILPRKIRNLIT